MSGGRPCPSTSPSSTRAIRTTWSPTSTSRSVVTSAQEDVLLEERQAAAGRPPRDVRELVVGLRREEQAEIAAPGAHEVDDEAAGRTQHGQCPRGEVDADEQRRRVGGDAR